MNDDEIRRGEQPISRRSSVAVCDRLRCDGFAITVFLGPNAEQPGRGICRSRLQMQAGCLVERQAWQGKVDR